MCVYSTQEKEKWCAVSSSGGIGPFWSEDGQGHTQTVTGERYRRISRRFVTVRQRRCADTHAIQGFQQDGATPHTAHDTIKLIQECFGTRVISRNTPHPWPANSPDLNPPAFFLWAYLKSLVYKGTHRPWRSSRKRYVLLSAWSRLTPAKEQWRTSVSEQNCALPETDGI